MTGILGKRWANIHEEVVKTLSYILGIFKLFAIENYGLYAFLWCLVLHIISFITDQVFFILDLLSSSLEL